MWGLIRTFVGRGVIHIMSHHAHRNDIAGDSGVLRAGETCWRIGRADRYAPIVDAAHYFAHLRDALLRAQQSVMFIGWEFDTRIKLAPDDPALDLPEELGDLLSALVERKRGLEIRVLQWNLGLLGTIARGTTPLFLLNWMRRRRFTFELDSAHPVGASHHQKVVVIDDKLAFCGGIDMTDDRWDTNAHLSGDERRMRPSGKLYEPFHDATVAVDGAAAKLLGELARERWRRATGEVCAVPKEGDHDLWPQALSPLLTNIQIGVSRTEPAYHENAGVREIERFYLAAIASSRKYLYIESQYFASRCIALALAERLREPDGPEVVIINPDRARGWLEEAAMGRGRGRVLAHLKAADLYNRFRIFRPVTDGGDPIYVHSKVLIADDVLLKIGSSNLNNRSMGLDTECDVVIDAKLDAATTDIVMRQIAGFRDRLVGEHLGVEPKMVADRMVDTGSIIAAIEGLQRHGSRTLRPVEPPSMSECHSIQESELLDPETPEPIWAAAAHAIKARWRRA